MACTGRLPAVGLPRCIPAACSRDVPLPHHGSIIKGASLSLIVRCPGFAWASRHARSIHGQAAPVRQCRPSQYLLRPWRDQTGGKTPPHAPFCARATPAVLQHGDGGGAARLERRWPKAPHPTLAGASSSSFTSSTPALLQFHLPPPGRSGFRPPVSPPFRLCRCRLHHNPCCTCMAIASLGGLPRPVAATLLLLLAVSRLHSPARAGRAANSA